MTSPAPIPTPRVALAEVALAAALQVDGVLGPQRGTHLRVGTGADGETLEGVAVTAQADGAYEVELGLRAALVPLHPLGGRVLAAVRQAAAHLPEAEIGQASVMFYAVEDVAVAP